MRVLQFLRCLSLLREPQTGVATMKTLRRLLVLCLAFFSLTGVVTAQELVTGEWEYNNSCAVCHGPEGKGDGEYAGFLKLPVPDLTELAKKNDGVFPFDDIYRIIDGRRHIKAHGAREMPIWGKYFTEVEPRRYDDATRAELARGRILAVAQYLYLIQAK